MRKKKVTWQDRACLATRHTRFGAILRCALNRDLDATPRFEGKAAITSDGFVQCDFVTEHGEGKHMAFVGAWSDVADNIDGLAAHLDLSPEDKDQLAGIIRSWVALDYRTN